MNAFKCVRCGGVFVTDADVAGRFDMTLTCPHCGLREYAHRFTGGERRRCNTAPERLSDGFLPAIDSVAQQIEYVTAFETTISNLSEEYNMAEGSIVELLNSLLRVNRQPYCYNPMRFKTLDEGSVSVDHLLRSIEQAVASAGARTTDVAPVSVPAGADPWRERCTQLEEKLQELKNENRQLMERIDELLEENRGFRELLG